jgi:hypothetical protein
MKLTAWIALTVCFSTALLEGKIIETKTTAEALAEVDAQTLLIFDLDNTVVMPAQTLGGEEWFDYLVTKYTGEYQQSGENAALAKLHAGERALREWIAVQKVTDVQAVEASAPQAIAEKQKQGTKTLGLTARPAELVKETHVQLERIGIQFDSAPVTKKKLTLAGIPVAQFDSSILFVGPLNSKGVVLTAFLDKTQYTPKKIVFVDNKRHHLEAVEKALSGRGIEFVGCRLGAADAKIAAFDAALADKQHFYFQTILSDAAIETLMKNGF